MMRVLAFGIAVAVGGALLAQSSTTADAADKLKAQKGRAQKHHVGRGIDIAAIDAVPVNAKKKPGLKGKAKGGAKGK
jgi:hypothetical protein